MGKTLYLDCTSGISGDMFAAALLDLGASEERLRAALASLPLGGYDLRVSRVSKAGLDCCDFDVALDTLHENHDHDMAYLHGHDRLHEHDGEDGHHHEHAHHHEVHHAEEHGHDAEHGHCHKHDHDHHGEPHHHHGHHHEHRGPADIDAMIDAGSLTEGAKALAHRIVDVLAHAEAKAHGVSLDEVHFHEVGAVDSIVDIVSAAVLVDDLGIDRVLVPQLVDGRGTIRCQHGIIPVPVPATLNIVQQHGLPLSVCGVEGELVTPTGAAIVAAIASEFELPARFRVERVGIGAGKRAYERPSILRAMLIDELPPLDAPAARENAACSSQMPLVSAGEPTVDAAYAGPVVRLECDIDDAPGEVLAYAAARLREAGAREVHWVPVYAKKGRPAWQLQVVAAPDDIERLEGIIFAETTTIGIRRWECERTVLARSESSVTTPWGTVRVKTVDLPDGSRRVSPEYEDSAALARAAGIPLQKVMDAVQLGIMGTDS